MVDPLISNLIRFAFAGLWGVAVLEKIARWPRFVRIVRAYHIVDRRFAARVAGMVVVAEAGLVCGLLLSPTVQVAAAGSVALLSIYAVLIARELLAQRSDHGCGCLGQAGEQGLSWALVVRNVVLAALVAILFLPEAQRPWHWLDSLTVAFALPILGLLYSTLDRMLAWPAIAKRSLLARANSPLSSDTRHE